MEKRHKGMHADLVWEDLSLFGYSWVILKASHSQNPEYRIVLRSRSSFQIAMRICVEPFKSVFEYFRLLLLFGSKQAESEIYGAQGIIDLQFDIGI